MDSDSHVVEEVRKRAMEISERYGHDIRKYLEHLKDVEKRYRNQMVDQVTVVKADPRIRSK